MFVLSTVVTRSPGWLEVWALNGMYRANDSFACEPAPTSQAMLRVVQGAFNCCKSWPLGTHVSLFDPDLVLESW